MLLFEFGRQKRSVNSFGRPQLNFSSFIIPSIIPQDTHTHTQRHTHTHKTHTHKHKTHTHTHTHTSISFGAPAACPLNVSAGLRLPFSGRLPAFWVEGCATEGGKCGKGEGKEKEREEQRHREPMDLTQSKSWQT